jgi:hypothetical protein
VFAHLGHWIDKKTGEIVTMIDFTPMKNGEMKILELSKHHTLADIRQTTVESLDIILDLIKDLHDGDVTFDPIDSLADDPYAKEGEEKIGWSLAHLVVHVTASSEETAFIGLSLARGIEFEGRSRYETPWETVTTVSQCVQRLEESRRMRLALIDAFPDTPFMETYRKLSPKFTEVFGEMNAFATVMFGLSHELGHHNQFRDVRQQALAARGVMTA